MLVTVQMAQPAFVPAFPGIWIATLVILFLICFGVVIIITLFACVAAVYMKWMFTGFSAHFPVYFSVRVWNGCTLGSKGKSYMEEHCHHTSKHSEQIPICCCMIPSEEEINEGWRNELMLQRTNLTEEFTDLNVLWFIKLIVCSPFFKCLNIDLGSLL